MSISEKPSIRPVSNADSFFGLALTQAFLGFAYGPSIEYVCEAGEIADAVYEDRMVPKRTNGRVNEVGVGKSLAGDFTPASQGHKTRTYIEPQHYRKSTFGYQPAYS